MKASRTRRIACGSLCGSEAAKETSALAGGGISALIGAAVGDTQSAIIGAAIGTGVG